MVIAVQEKPNAFRLDWGSFLPFTNALKLWVVCSRASDWEACVLALVAASVGLASPATPLCGTAPRGPSWENSEFRNIQTHLKHVHVWHNDEYLAGFFSVCEWHL